MQKKPYGGLKTINKLNMEEEVFRDVPDYEGMYKVSNLGRVKSIKFNKEKILKLGVDGVGYLQVKLCCEGKVKNVKIHQLVAIAFLNHTPDGFNGLIVDHKDNDPLNNNVNNLQLVTNRENLSKDKKGSSKFTGVSWDKASNKWRSQIRINGKYKHLGRFNNEEEASEYYQSELIKLKQLNK